jgi:S-formylglutathione hydrolase FrmB
MGGYGALRLGAKYANRFFAISVHSAVTRIQEISGFVEEPIDKYIAEEGSDELDPVHWCVKNRNCLPKLRIDCGQDDLLAASNLEFHRNLNHYSIPHTYQEHLGGHDWFYWKMHISETLIFVWNC